MDGIRREEENNENDWRKEEIKRKFKKVEEQINENMEESGREIREIWKYYGWKENVNK